MDQPKPTLVTLGSACGLQNFSPFCLKAEMLMTQLGLKYEIAVQADPRKAPKGKLPYLTSDGDKLPDFELITKRFDALTQGRVYGGLAAKDQAFRTALSRLVDDHLYWILVASCWLDDDWFVQIIDGFFTLRQNRCAASSLGRRANKSRSPNFCAA